MMENFEEQDDIVIYEPHKGDFSSSYVGGDWLGGECPRCKSCRSSTAHVLCLDKLHVFGCNRACCSASMFSSQAFSMGGDGVYHILQAKDSLCEMNEAAPLAIRMNETCGAIDLTENNDWDFSDDENDNGNDENLHAMLDAMEQTKLTETKPTSRSVRTNSQRTSKRKGILPRFELRVMEYWEDYVEEDADDKIQQMLARYLNEEEDDDIVAALQPQDQSMTTSSNKNLKATEKEERESRQDRALDAFAKLLNQAPQQVVRKGEKRPIWSIPEPLGDENWPAVPPCSTCNEPRVFNFQIMPTLLHTLQVDKHAVSGSSEIMQIGGMDWGTMVVYVCPECTSPFLIVQDSVDHAAMMQINQKKVK